MKSPVWTLFVVGVALSTIALGIPVRIPNPTHAPAARPVEAQPAGSLVDDLHNVLHAGEEAREKDPLRALTGDMDQIVTELDQDHTDAPVQTEQRQVVAHLDKLIDELNKQCNGSGSGSSNNPTKPMADSKIAKGPGGSGPMHDPKAGTKNWGQLPPKEREQILQSQNEGFPAGYESILSSYYNRLSQEQVGDEGKGTPATQPAP